MRDEEAKQVEIVALRESGSQNPLFCFPGAGGAVTIFEEMTSSIDADRSVYGVDMQKFFDCDRSFSVEQLASVCLSVVREKQKHGPYFMCGYSFGAIVAYEMATRLRHLGEDIAILALIDTGNPAFRSQLSPIETQQVNKSYATNRLKKYFHILASGNIRTFASGVSALFAARASVRTRRMVRWIFRTVNRPMPYIFRHNDRTLFDAWMAYRPPPGALQILLFYWDQRLSEYGGDQTLGWHLCTSAEIELELASESHVDMMRIPHVRGFASRLSECLKRAQ